MGQGLLFHSRFTCGGLRTQAQLHSLHVVLKPTQPMDTGGETKPGLLLSPALRPAHSRAQDPLFVANVVQTLPSALRVSLLLCCQ